MLRIYIFLELSQFHSLQLDRLGGSRKVFKEETEIIALDNSKGRKTLTWFASVAGDSGVLPSNLLLLIASFVSLGRFLSR